MGPVVRLVLVALTPFVADGASLRATESRKLQGSNGVQYLIDTLTKFEAFAVDSRAALQSQHQENHAKLVQAAAAAEDPGVRLALDQSVTDDKESFLETQSIYDEMANFTSSMSSLMQNVVYHAPACDTIRCGQHATCTITLEGASCICDQGYVGTGHDCHAPYEFMPHPLLVGGQSISATDIHVGVFANNRIAVVFREFRGDDAPKNSGQVVVGRVKESGLAALAPAEQFTEGDGAAYQPVVAGVAENRIVIIWRDDPQRGACYMRAAVLGGTGISGADTAITWGATANFCESQAHKMSVVPLQQGRFAVLFNGHTREPVDSFGAAILGVVESSGAIVNLGQFRFTESPVCRLEVTQLTPTSFIVAAKGRPAVDELDPSVVTQQEAMAVYGEVVGDMLAFDPNVVNLEPIRGQIWSRGVSVIASNTYAYAYQDGGDAAIKLAVVAVDPVLHKMVVKSRDQVIRRAVSPYVSTLSMPQYTGSDPHTLVFYEDTKANTSMVSVCSYSAADALVSRCQDFPWLDERVASISGVTLGHGQFLFTFTTRAGIPYYSTFGVVKK